jgi:hypothetical protein
MDERWLMCGAAKPMRFAGWVIGGAKPHSLNRAKEKSRIAGKKDALIII